MNSGPLLLERKNSSSGAKAVVDGPFPLAVTDRRSWNGRGNQLTVSKHSLVEIESAFVRSLLSGGSARWKFCSILEGIVQGEKL